MAVTSAPVMMLWGGRELSCGHLWAIVRLGQFVEVVVSSRASKTASDNRAFYGTMGPLGERCRE